MSDWDAFPMPVIHMSEGRVTQDNNRNRLLEDQFDRHLDAAEQALGWVGSRRRESYRMARLTDDRVRAFFELTRLAEEESPRTACWQALENAAEKLGIEEDDSEQGQALRLIRTRLGAG